MDIHVYIYIYICIRMCIYIYIYMYTYVYVSICVGIYIYIYIYVHTHLCVYTFTYVYILTYVCVKVSVYVCAYVSVYIHAPAHWPSGTVFTNGPRDLGSIPGCVIPKTLKMLLDTSLLNHQQYKVKWSNQGKGVAPSPTPRCRTYWKGSLLVALDYGCQLYIRVYVCICVCI